MEMEPRPKKDFVWGKAEARAKSAGLLPTGRLDIDPESEIA